MDTKNVQISDMMFLLRMLGIKARRRHLGLPACEIGQLQALRWREETGAEPAATYQDVVSSRKCLGKYAGSNEGISSANLHNSTVKNWSVASQESN